MIDPSAPQVRDPADVIAARDLRIAAAIDYLPRIDPSIRMHSSGAAAAAPRGVHAP
jgi:hypothetical protein